MFAGAGSKIDASTPGASNSTVASVAQA